MVAAYIIILVDKTKLRSYTPHRRSTTVSLETDRIYLDSQSVSQTMKGSLTDRQLVGVRQTIRKPVSQRISR